MYTKIVGQITVLLSERFDVNGERNVVSKFMIRRRCIIVDVELALIIVTERVGDDLRRRIFQGNTPSGTVYDVSAQTQAEGFGTVCSGLVVTIHFGFLLFEAVCKDLYIWFDGQGNHGWS